jgi:hypothetical protein
MLAMTKHGTKALNEAVAKGRAVAFRGHHLRGDQFVCRAEWEEDGVSHYAFGKRFRSDSDRKADYLAEEIMRAQLNIANEPKA